MASTGKILGGDSSSTEPSNNTADDERQKCRTIRRKIDRRLLPFYFVTFIVLKVSERNIINAAILNLEQGTDIQNQLHITPDQWKWVISSFTYGFMFFEAWSTIVFKYYGPRKFMIRLLLTWGLVSMSHGAVRSFAGLIACRVLLGICEAGFLPAAIFHLSFWYPTSKLYLRYAILFSSTAASGVLSGVLAWAISHMNGSGGLPGWRWLFLLEGLPAMLCAVGALLWMPTYPSKAKFLTDDEKDLLKQHLSDDQPTETAKTVDWAQIKDLFRDSTFYLWTILWTCQATGGFSVATILAAIIYQLKLQGTATTQLLTMPAFISTAVLQLSLAWLVQKEKINAWITCICFGIATCVSYAVLIGVRNPVVKYIAIELGLTSAVTVFPLLWPERVKSARGTTATGLAISITSMCAHMPGLLGPQIYGHQFGPHYSTSFAISLGLLSTALFFIVILWTVIRRRDGGTVDAQEEA